MTGKRGIRLGLLGVGAAVLALLVIAPFPSATASDDCRALATQTSFSQIVGKAKTIVLATAVTAEPAPFAQNNTVKFTFDVKDAIKGNDSRDLKITAKLADDDARQGDLDAHKRMSFWDRMETRMVHVSSCHQDLTFKLGTTYLLIDPGKRLAPMTISYEIINDEKNDAWLKSVRDMVETPDGPARQMSVEEYFKAQQSVVFAVMPYCNDKLRDGAFRVADLSEPLWGDPVVRDSLDPDLFEDALKGCEGLTVLLGLFYQPDQSRPRDAPLGVNIYPGQRFVAVRGDVITLADLQTEVEIVGPPTLTLPELIALLKGA